MDLITALAYFAAFAGLLVVLVLIFERRDGQARFVVYQGKLTTRTKYDERLERQITEALQNPVQPFVALPIKHGMRLIPLWSDWEWLDEVAISDIAAFEGMYGPRPPMHPRFEDGRFA